MAIRVPKFLTDLFGIATPVEGKFLSWGPSGTVVNADPPAAPTPSLDQIADPAADKTFTMANKTIAFNFTAPQPPGAGGQDGAFEVQATGGFTGDLLHVHQHTGNPGPGTDLIHIEFSDVDVTGLRITAPSTAAQAATITGRVDVSGAVAATSVTSGGSAVHTAASLTNLNQLTNGPGFISSVPDATAAVKGAVQLAGDLGGTAAAPTVPGLAGKAATVHSHSDATTGAAGFMSAADKTKLDGVATGANNYTLPNATSSVTGGVRLTGDLGGTATSPTVPGLAGKANSTHTHAGSDVTSAVANATTAATANAVAAGAVGIAGLSASGTPSASTYLRGDNTWATPAGGGGSPGGSAESIQYNDGAGGFAGNANLKYDVAKNHMEMLGTDPAFCLAPVTNEPTPESGELILYNKSIAGRYMPKWLGPAGIDTPFQPFVGMNHVRTVFPGSSTTAITIVDVTGMGFTASANTYSQPTITYSNIKSRSRFCTLATNTTLGGMAYIRSVYAECSTDSGFFLVNRFGLYSLQSNNRFFFGLWAGAANPTNVDPVTATTGARIGVAANTNTGNLNIVHGNGTSVTAADLGANFAINTTDLWELVLFCAPQGSTVNYRMTNLSTGSQTSGTLSTTLPANTVAMSWHNWAATNQAASCGFVFKSAYLETDY